MDPVTVTLLESAFSLSRQILELFSKRQDAGPRPAAINVEQLERFMTSAVPRIEATVQDATRLVIEKIESDKLEELLSRSRNLSTLIELKRRDQVVHYAMTLRETIDYAKNRVSEGKIYWLGPYIGSSAIFLGAMAYADSYKEDDVTALDSLVMRAKMEILDSAVPGLLKHGPSLPWADISLFLSHAATGVPESISTAFKLTPPPEAKPDGGPQSRRRLADAIKEHLEGKASVHVAPGIPQAKINGARKKLLKPADSGDELLALVDTTIFGGAAEGLAIFETYVTYCDLGDNPMRFTFDELRNSALVIDGNLVYAGGRKMNVYDADVATGFVAVIKSTGSARP